ncbi:protein of unknown function, partial [Pseudomonas inefficax]
MWHTEPDPVLCHGAPPHLPQRQPDAPVGHGVRLSRCRVARHRRIADGRQAQCAWRVGAAGPHSRRGQVRGLNLGRQMLALVQSNAELVHQRLLLVGQAVQRLADPRRLVGLPRQRLGDVADGRHVAVDFLGHRALLLGGRGDLQVHVGDHRHGLADALQRGDCLANLLHAALCLAVAVVHGPDHFA